MIPDTNRKRKDIILVMEKEIKKTGAGLPSCPQGQAESLSLYPGIRLYPLLTEADTAPLQQHSLKHILEIHHCRAGRICWKTENENGIHLGPGDFSLRSSDAGTDFHLCFPAGSYEGLMLRIDLEEFSAHPPELLAGTGIEGEMLCKKWCKNGAFASFAGNVQTDAIFSAFYGQPEHRQLAYQKIKCLELLLFLGKKKAAPAEPLTEFQSEQVAIIRAIHDQLTQNIRQRITIESLSRQYLINPTTLKEVFKSVYGTSIAAHIKEHRMELAAQLLLETDLHLAEIGQQVGYESQSKFTSAFKAYYQMLPTEYRKIHRT